MRLAWMTLAALCLLVSGAKADCKRLLPDHRPVAGKNKIAEAWFAEPTDRYRHFVLGGQYEAGSLCARLRDGKVLELTLPATDVFEDRSPRLASIDGSGADQIVVIRSRVDRGAAIVVADVRNGKLEIIAESPPTGRQNTWTNVAGIADFTGTGRPTIAAVQLPHALGRLVAWQLDGGALKEVTMAPDASNHVIGSPALGLSIVADFNGDGVADLAVASFDRRSLRFITFKGGVVREFARHKLRARAASNFELAIKDGQRSVVVGLEDGTKQVVTVVE